MGTSTSIIDKLSIVNGDISATAEIGRAKFALESKKFAQPLESLRIFDSAANAVLPNSAAADDLALIVGTLATDGHSIRTSDAKATTVTQKAAFTFTLPAEYEAGGTITLVPHAGMLTTISDGTATVDFSVYWKDESDISHSSDLCTTAATTINSLTLGAKSFTITPTSRVNGDELGVLMTIAITDAATGTAVLGLISKIHWLLQVRG
jgi:hypothetical protein